ncbi:MAG: chromate transporter [Marinifilaceae bacterium]|nr:chromate transporter [Marinifilaceae bacterium]
MRKRIDRAMGLNSKLFVSFFKIGGFTIGGGFAMIPLMQREVVEKHGWLDEKEFIDILAVAQSSPGIFAVNMATYVGKKIGGAGGAFMAVLGNIMPSLVSILAIAMFFRSFRENQVIEHIFMGVRPAVVALIAAPAFKMAKSLDIGWNNFWIPIVGAVLISFMGVSPIYVILGAGLGGFIYGWIKRRMKGGEK